MHISIQSRTFKSKHSINWSSLIAPVSFVIIEGNFMKTLINLICRNVGNISEANPSCDWIREAVIQCHFKRIYIAYAAAAAKSLQSCQTLCDPMDCSLPGSSVHGIFQARVLEWVAIAFSYILPMASVNHLLRCSSIHSFKKYLLFRMYLTMSYALCQVLGIW